MATRMPPLSSVAPGYVGPVVLPTGREVWWTGRVAIGLRHPDHARTTHALPESGRWVQAVLRGERP